MGSLPPRKALRRQSLKPTSRTVNPPTPGRQDDFAINWRGLLRGHHQLSDISLVGFID